MFATRRTFSALPALRNASQRASFHASVPAFVKAGDAIPDVELHESSPGNKVSIAKELKGKGLIIGVPAAFSTAHSPSPFSVHFSPIVHLSCKIARGLQRQGVLYFDR